MNAQVLPAPYDMKIAMLKAMARQHFSMALHMRDCRESGMADKFLTLGHKYVKELAARGIEYELPEWARPPVTQSDVARLLAAAAEQKLLPGPEGWDDPDR